MSCTGTSSCTCCTGTSVQTPVVRNNLPGLASVAYRMGTWSSFKESMLARLSSADYPALAPLRTRADDDFTIALLDATSTVLDILTFYQERLANESFLRTASQPRSLTELSRLIGYQPSPGVSASVYVAFTLRSAPGQSPDPNTPAIIIPLGTQLQSVPAQGQTPQSFETSADIQAKADWSALPVQTSRPWLPNQRNGATSLYLSGTTTQLQPGDALLILGVDRENWISSSAAAPREQWDIVLLTEVDIDLTNKLTRVSWQQPLAHQTSGSASTSQGSWSIATVFALRQRASLFGHNAPNPNLFVNLNPPPATTTPAQPAQPLPVLIRANDDATTTPVIATSLPGLIDTSKSDNWVWKNYQVQSSLAINLDATYPRIAPGGWFALISANQNADGSSSPIAQLYQVSNAVTRSISNFALSGKVTSLTGDFNDHSIQAQFPIPSTEVLAQSEQLGIAPQPLTYPLYGSLLDLRDLRPDLVALQVVALFGKRQKIAVNPGITSLSFVPDAAATSTQLQPGDILTVTTPPPLNADGTVPDWSSSTSPVTLSVQDSGGRTGVIQGTAATPASLSQFSFAPSSAGDPNISEYAVVSSITTITQSASGSTVYPHTQIQLASPLANCYDRTATTVNANVALATHGQSVSEFLGSGNASTPNQSFLLKQSPLTYVQAPTPTGQQSTLEVQVNRVAWTEVPSLSSQGPSARAFATLDQPNGTAEILFGDGIEGSVLPTGQNNLLANYRIGLGSSGNVAANTLTTLVDRPLGVSGVSNPAPATGGQDPQSPDDIRANAPLTVLTLGRAVSLADYENYAATFAGIAKAHALWVPSGPGQGIFLTVAGVGGAALPPGNPTLAKLVASLKNYGNPLIPITAQSFLETIFGLNAALQYDPAYDQSLVQANVLQTLAQTYSFAQRSFGQGVSIDEVSTVIQSVPGVIAVNVTGLYAIATSSAGDLAGGPGGFSVASYNTWRSMAQPVSSDLARRSQASLSPPMPVATATALPKPAGILVLDPDPTSVVLGVMA